MNLFILFLYADQGSVWRESDDHFLTLGCQRIGGRAYPHWPAMRTGGSGGRLGAASIFRN